LAALLLSFVLALAPSMGAGAGDESAPHDLHLTSANAVVEGESVLVRIRFFKDDLEAALGRRLGVSVLAMADTPEVRRVFLAYLAEHLEVAADSAPLKAVLLASGEDVLDREPVWWCALEYRADAPVGELTMRNTLLFELFDDQRNVVKFIHLPDETQQTFAFARGEEEFRVTFGGG
jgi:hypothetical protein